MLSIAFCKTNRGAGTVLLPGSDALPVPASDHHMLLTCVAELSACHGFQEAVLQQGVNAVAHLQQCKCRAPRSHAGDKLLAVKNL